MRIDVAQLKLGDPFASGGQGDIYQLDPAVTGAVGWSAPALAKLYKRRLPESALRAFLRRVQWAQSLTPDTRAELYRISAWPLMVIEAKGMLAGVVMPDARDHYGTLFRLPSGGTEPLLMSLDHMLSDDGYVERCFGFTCNTRVRASLAERLAAALAVLHKHAIVASDISHANILVKLEEPCSAMFIDCDSMTFQGESTMPLVETPDWEIPSEWGELANTRGADAYKLGLAIMRLFARERGLRDPHSAEAHIPTALRPLVKAALGDRPERRPTAGQWRAALRDILGTRLDRDFPGPPPRGPRGATGTKPPAVPSPVTPAPPVVRLGGPTPAGSPLATPIPTGTVAGLGAPAPTTAQTAPTPTAPPAMGSPIAASPGARISPAPTARGARGSPPNVPRAAANSRGRRWVGLAVLVLAVVAAIVAAQAGSSPSSSNSSQLGPSTNLNQEQAGRANENGPSTHRTAAKHRRRPHRARTHVSQHEASTAVRPHARGLNSGASSHTSSSGSSAHTAPTHTSPSTSGGGGATSNGAPPSSGSPAGLEGGSEHAQSPPAGRSEAGGLEGGSQGEPSSGGEGGLSGKGSH